MNKKIAGFTLIELMIVAVIIAVLATLGGGAYITSVKRGRDTERISELKAIAAAQEQYYGRFPGGGTYEPGFAGTPCANAANLQPFFSSNAMPQSPTGNYTCAISPANTSFCVSATLELPEGKANCGSCDCTSDPCVMTTASPNTSFCVLSQQ